MVRDFWRSAAATYLTRREGVEDLVGFTGIRAPLRELRYRSRQALVATKQVLGLSGRADKTFFIERFDRALRAGRLGRDVAVMATGKDDGAGSQAQAAMSALCFARAHGLTVCIRRRPWSGLIRLR